MHNHRAQVLTNNARRISYFKFIGGSLIGITLFLVPVSYKGSWTIILGLISEEFVSKIGDGMAYFTIPIFVTGAVISIVYNLTPASFATKLPLSKRFIATHWIWTVLAICGGIFATLTTLSLGPDWIISKETGVTAYIDVAGVIFLLIGLGCLFLPFLTDYGLLEFVGTQLQKPFQKLFKLPGRATIDTLASWVGSSSIAVIMTGFQYERGFYTARESAVIATNFSVVSIPFVVLIAQVSGLREYFFHLYSSMIFVCVICAFITPKLPPLSRIKDEYYGPVGKQFKDDVLDESSNFDRAISHALKTANRADNPLKSLKKGFNTMLDIFFMMMPAAMTIEFLTLAIFHHTSFFQILSYPLIPVLNVLQIPEVAGTAPGVIIGLLDQFVPAILAGTLNEPIAKFILAGLSVTQLIFFAETAILIMRSAIPISVLQLIAIFFIRTIIALPLLTLIAHLIF